MIDWGEGRRPFPAARREEIEPLVPPRLAAPGPVVRKKIFLKGGGIWNESLVGVLFYVGVTGELETTSGRSNRAASWKNGQRLCLLPTAASECVAATRSASPSFFPCRLVLSSFPRFGALNRCSAACSSLSPLRFSVSGASVIQRVVDDPVVVSW